LSWLAGQHRIDYHALPGFDSTHLFSHFGNNAQVFVSGDKGKGEERSERRGVVVKDQGLIHA